MGNIEQWKMEIKMQKNTKVDPEEKFLRRLFLTGALRSERGKMVKLPRIVKRLKCFIFYQRKAGKKVTCNGILMPDGK